MAALYRAPAVFRPARADVQVEADALAVTLPDGRTRRHALHACTAHVADGCFIQRVELRRFVRVLVVSWDGRGERVVIVTPPELGAVAPRVVGVSEVGGDAAVVETRTWDALANWLLAGGRLAACSVHELVQLASIAAPSFAALIGEVMARRALELASGGGPLRGGLDPDAVLAPLVEAARHSSRAAEALVAALAHAAGVARRRRRA
jgi:hypothetical protein|nr:hypothetical protein [Kofleriaceae bacterium]